MLWTFLQSEIIPAMDASSLCWKIKPCIRQDNFNCTVLKKYFFFFVIEFVWRTNISCAIHNPILTILSYFDWNAYGSWWYVLFWLCNICFYPVLVISSATWTIYFSPASSWLLHWHWNNCIIYASTCADKITVCNILAGCKPQRNKFKCAPVHHCQVLTWSRVILCQWQNNAIYFWYKSMEWFI